MGQSPIQAIPDIWRKVSASRIPKRLTALVRDAMYVNRREAFRVLELVSGVIMFACTLSRECGNLILKAQCTYYARITVAVHNLCVASH
jgi:hypothetical protein